MGVQYFFFKIGGVVVGEKSSAEPLNASIGMELSRSHVEENKTFGGRVLRLFSGAICQCWGLEVRRVKRARKFQSGTATLEIEKQERKYCIALTEGEREGQPKLNGFEESKREF